MMKKGSSKANPIHCFFCQLIVNKAVTLQRKRALLVWVKEAGNVNNSFGVKKCLVDQLSSSICGTKPAEQIKT
ncbi:MAG: hypothetical protein P0Y53_22435 [Candidatus Pseudobacter hemicellulosilyticus]|uniref:Uncharacterized protein n=1 Tax=Candidatus Pseudobacter hemicellulosilyticus TaxID=3121375 RepID=A0AAJ5WRL6_9BACT|nr:MAG: hypothetical protein P0Y53_22435 [Pseudobacter sp.]